MSCNLGNFDIAQIIISFFKAKKPQIIIQSPSRINIINPLDAVEGDYWMPSVAINGAKDPLSTFLYVCKTHQPSKVKFYELQRSENGIDLNLQMEQTIDKDPKKMIPLFSGELRLFYGSIYILSVFSHHFRKKFEEAKIEIGILTTIPRQSGLGGSASLIIAILYGLIVYFDLLNNFNFLNEKGLTFNKDIIAELAMKVEDKLLGITAGYGDRYVITRGGLCFCSYYGKFHHKKITTEPLAVYDRIDETYEINEIPLIVCFSGVFHKSGDVHGKLRASYLREEPNILQAYENLAFLSWKSRFALMSKNWIKLGTYCNLNTKIMNDVMKNIGFEYGIGLANNILINLIQDCPDVYTAKLTGAGGGGSVFALVNPGKKKEACDFWKTELNHLISSRDYFVSKFPNYPTEIKDNLKNARFYHIKLDKEGVKKLDF